MEFKGSPFSLLISFYSRLDLAGDTIGVDSRHKIREYAIREINFFLWLALIFLTAFLLKKLVMMLDLRRRGDPMQISLSPTFSGDYKILSWENPQENLIGKHH